MHRILTLLTFLSLTLISTAQPAKALFHVLVVDNKDIPQEGEKVIFKNINDNTEVSGITDTAGKFDLELLQGVQYAVTIVTFGKEDDSKIIEVPSAPGKVEVDYKIMTYYIGTFLLDIRFESAKAALDSVSYKTLDEFYEMLDLKKDIAVEIGGHTDNVGDENFNMQLSQDRANAVRDYLVKKGIAPERIIAKGYGETDPVESNDTPEGRQKNRRTEVKIIQQ